MSNKTSMWSKYDQDITDLFSSKKIGWRQGAAEILNKHNERYTNAELDLFRTYVARFVKREKIYPGKSQTTKSVSDKGLQFEYKGERPITSVEEAIEFFEVDTKKYVVERFITNAWDVTGAEMGKRTNYQVKVTFVPRKPDNLNFEELTKDMIKQMDKHSPELKDYKYDKVSEKHCLILDLADLHIGKYAAETETGEGYNTKLALKRAHEGLNGLISKSQGYPIDKIVFVIGNDVLHTDTPTRTTTSGTPQDTDGMWHENFLAARQLYVECIEKLRAIAPVHVIYCPSNHDYMSGFMLADSIKSWFRSTSNVTFDTSIAHRKYFVYGKNLLGFSHGDGAKLNDYPLLMATESAQGWADTTYRNVYLHHVHHKDVYKFQAAKDFAGVTVEYLRSPSSADGWHSRNGFQHSKRAVQGFIHSKEDGEAGTITHLF